MRDTHINKGRLRSTYITSIISISLVLLLVGLLGLLILNVKKISNHVKENIGFSIILKDNVKEVDIIRLQKTLDASSYVKATEYITKERAARELQEELGEDFIEFLGYNPLLASIDVKMYAQYANPDSIAIIEKDLQQYEEVKEVFYQKSLVHLINENVKKISIFILVLSSILLLIAIALINNSIRLSIYSKRFIINTMQLVGATRSFIRRPFLFKSAGQGIYSAIIAISLLIGFLYYIQQVFEGIINLRDIEILGFLLVFITFLGVLLCWVSTYFAVNRYLKLNTDELYY